MNPLQIIGMLQNSGNPMAMLQQMCGNNPLMQRAVDMSKNKSADQMKQTVRNLARQRGMDDSQLSQFLSQFGLQL